MVLTDVTAAAFSVVPKTASTSSPTLFAGSITLLARGTREATSICPSLFTVIRPVFSC